MKLQQLLTLNYFYKYSLPYYCSKLPLLYFESTFGSYFSEGPSWSWSCGSWIYNFLCNQWLSPLKLWARIPHMARCIRYNIMWYILSVTWDRSVFFSVYSCFLHQWNWPPRYNWNIVESGVKHHNPNHIFGIICFRNMVSHPWLFSRFVFRRHRRYFIPRNFIVWRNYTLNMFTLLACMYMLVIFYILSQDREHIHKRRNANIPISLFFTYQSNVI